MPTTTTLLLLLLFYFCSFGNLLAFTAQSQHVNSRHLALRRVLTVNWLPHIIFIVNFAGDTLHIKRNGSPA
jgi:hypothetical protein